MSATFSTPVLAKSHRANWRSTESAATTLRGARNVANWAR